MPREGITLASLTESFISFIYCSVCTLKNKVAIEKMAPSDMYELEKSRNLKKFIKLMNEQESKNARIFVYVLDEPNFFRGSKFKEAKLLLCYGNPFDKKKMILVSRNDLEAVLGKEYKKDLVLNMALMYKVLYEIGVEIANMIEKEGITVPGKGDL